MMDKRKIEAEANPLCEGCSLEHRSCDYTRCVKWRDWFSKEWNGIRRAAEEIRENKREREERFFLEHPEARRRNK